MTAGRRPVRWWPRPANDGDLVPPHGQGYDERQRPAVGIEVSANLEDMRDDGDLDPAGDRPAAGRHHEVGVLGDVGGDGNRLAQVDPACGELAEPFRPRRAILADRQVLADKGRRHRLGLGMTRRAGQCWRRRTRCRRPRWSRCRWSWQQSPDSADRDERP